MSIFTNRMKRESETVKAMIDLYCRDHHKLNVSKCSICSELKNYALDRLHHCPFHEGKTVCKNCPVHCYKPAIKEEIRVVMRYSGPRMMLRHPILTIFHLLDRHRKDPLSDYLKKGNTTSDSDGECKGPVNQSEMS